MRVAPETRVLSFRPDTLDHSGCRLYVNTVDVNSVNMRVPVDKPEAGSARGAES